MMSKRKKQEKVGGLAFYCSLIALIMLAPCSLLALPVVFEESAPLNLGLFAAGIILGVWIALSFLRGKVSVFIHELKHSILSNLAGNRARRMKVEHDRGSFEYQYSRATAHFNALIALAPYTLPLFSVLSLGIAALFWGRQHEIMAVLVGMGYGLDLALGLADLSPHQPDLSEIRGGPVMGYIYVIAMQSCIFAFVCSWAMLGSRGLTLLLQFLWHLAVRVVGMPAESL